MIKKLKNRKYLTLIHSNKMEVINALGRRKTSVARVYLSKGTGAVTVNKKDYKVAFPITVLQAKIERPFQLTDTIGQYDVSVNVFGGGINGQAEAIRLGIARALVKVAEENKIPQIKAFLVNNPSRMIPAYKNIFNIYKESLKSLNIT